jgi:hypothetical protein
MTDWRKRAIELHLEVRRWKAMLAPKPKTREQVLEEALREIAAITFPTGEMNPPRGGGQYLPIEIARRALEYKP